MDDDYRVYEDPMANPIELIGKKVTVEKHFQK